MCVVSQCISIEVLRGSKVVVEIAGLVSVIENEQHRAMLHLAHDRRKEHWHRGSHKALKEHSSNGAIPQGLQQSASLRQTPVKSL